MELLIMLIIAIMAFAVYCLTSTGEKPFIWLLIVSQLAIAAIHFIGERWYFLGFHVVLFFGLLILLRKVQGGDKTERWRNW